MLGPEVVQIEEQAAARLVIQVAVDQTAHFSRTAHLLVPVRHDSQRQFLGLAFVHVRPRVQEQLTIHHLVPRVPWGPGPGPV